MQYINNKLIVDKALNKKTALIRPRRRQYKQWL